MKSTKENTKKKSSARRIVSVDTEYGTSLQPVVITNLLDVDDDCEIEEAIEAGFSSHGCGGGCGPNSMIVFAEDYFQGHGSMKVEIDWKDANRINAGDYR